MKRKIFMILALLCAFAQGARAQNEWATVYTQTLTTSANWTALNAGSTTGRTLGSADATTYYYASGNLSFTNSTAGGSGLTILGTVYLYVPSGITVTCTGANANGQTGAGAGIELTTGNSLYLIGGGTINATGGNAANGGNGGTGGNATGSNGDWTQTGAGGTGGYGGGGAGAGIGTRGGAGGSGGSGGAGYRYDDGAEDDAQNGTNGSVGNAGSTASAMGNLYVFQTAAVMVNATGGSQGTSGGSGQRGRGYAYDGYSYNVSVAGGGGGGGGGFGGAASNIGTGGPGGGGGGGGAGGAQDWKSSGVYDVTAPGGHGGQNANGTYAADGTEAATTGTATSQGWVTVENGRFGDDWNPASGDATFGTGGSGGARGNASTSGSASAVTLDWTTQEDDWSLICLRTNSTRANWVHLADGSTKGKTLGAAGTTTYYYTAFDRTFSNSNAGGSGLTILGTVYLYIPSGKTITCTGANATAPTGGGAGIELAAGNTLYIIGSGTLNATGGNAANGGNGGAGGDADFSVYNWVQSGAGGKGGDGGGGAGAGIGTCGGAGGTGGTGGASNIVYLDYGEPTGNVGGNGASGSTAAEMGTLYIYQLPAPTTEFHGGSGGTASDNGGNGGRHALYRHTYGQSTYYTWTMGGGGGGGGGGFGGAASDIGTGGPGGGGGGGGASGSIQYKDGQINFYYVGALGGSPGTNVDGTLAGAGESTLMVSDDPNLLARKYPESRSYVNPSWQDGDNRAAGGNGNGGGAASVSGSANAVTAGWPTQGKGIEDAPFIVSSTDDWNEFASYVNGGYAFSGNFVKLGANISVSTMAGTNNANSFQGTFDGDGQTLTFTKGTSAEPFAEEYCAPFRHVKNATIKNLHVAGTIYTSAKKAAGFVGESHGALTLTGCISSVNINSSVSGDGTHGGLVSTLSGENNTVTIDGCVFDGSFATTAGTNNCGGFIGWVTYNRPTITNSLMKPSSVGAGMLSNTFSRWHATYEPAIVNCYYYYTEALGTAQGTQAYSISGGTGVTVANAGAVSNNYDVSGLTFYATGLKYGDAHYAGNGDSVSLTLGSPVAASAAEYYASAGTLSGTGNPYTLTMPAADVVINVNVLQAIGAARWYAISTPMHDDGQNYESVGNVTNLTGTAYDLLRYNESSSTWENQKAGSGASGFSTLEPGRGYIYRCSAPRTLTYTGVPNSEESYSVSLTASSAAGDLKGFNLVGNPYPFKVLLNRAFYSLNADGTWQAHPDGDSLLVGQAALVYATSDEPLTFDAATRSTNPSMDALPALPKALCLGGNTQDSYSTHSTHFAHQDGNSIVVTGTGTLQAYDIMGRLLFRMELNTEHLTLNTSLFPSAGVYLLRLGSQSQKIVIR